MHQPTEIKLQQKSHKLVITFNTGETFELPCEYLRVYSQSAEVTGHGPGQEVLQVGKQNVNIDAITPVGNYAVKLHFDDGHDTGIYSWETLYDLGKNHNSYWQAYLQKLLADGHKHPDMETHVADLL
ncbi:gamma-butyrobetaine hydroxylase-like domain-containing protein [Hydrogenovibrio marinus]|uniref:Gamma-butyrobetaine hydroxylase-like N-terminal domain-containing protein n=1 Tax=Hydrogenovibrio marinus TaxID=28885 RepID=A0A066ZSD2_HYDMR|nr:DUF971 domain-containing protein [Hydrogenovibrio marinus]KDN96417.1 hypothetical protein EI16_09115 [Hydrogenovibrio marinus]BBN60387.1 hypothetical protein HVMH_1981 [Hydrogenovibrio marinus]